MGSLQSATTTPMETGRLATTAAAATPAQSEINATLRPLAWLAAKEMKQPSRDDDDDAAVVLSAWTSLRRIAAIRIPVLSQLPDHPPGGLRTMACVEWLVDSCRPLLSLPQTQLGAQCTRLRSWEQVCAAPTMELARGLLGGRFLRDVETALHIPEARQFVQRYQPWLAGWAQRSPERRQLRSQICRQIDHEEDGRTTRLDLVVRTLQRWQSLCLSLGVTEDTEPAFWTQVGDMVDLGGTVPCLFQLLLPLSPPIIGGSWAADPPRSDADWGQALAVAQCWQQCRGDPWLMCSSACLRSGPASEWQQRLFQAFGLPHRPCCLLMLPEFHASAKIAKREPDHNQ